MRIDFYHLQRSTLDQVLPLLLEKAYQSKARVLVRTSLSDRAEYLNSLLWTYAPDKWLPHGTEKDDFSEEQPIFIASDHKNPNKATIVVLTEGGSLSDITGFDRCLNIFNGADESELAKARALWKQAKEEGNSLNYWQQNDLGQWESKLQTGQS